MPWTFTRGIRTRLRGGNAFCGVKKAPGCLGDSTQGTESDTGKAGPYRVEHFRDRRRGNRESRCRPPGATESPRDLPWQVPGATMR